MINYGEIEEKWQKAWREAKIFEGDINDRKPYFVTAAFPYPNGPQHIGHLRTYGTADTLARFRRMQGYNVLYPMAFHATGTPILAFAKRIRSKDADLIKDLKMFHIPDEDIAKMTEPLFIANYFIAEIQKGMIKAGYSIDWRRKFVSIEPFFSKLIEWQFGMLNSRGYLTKGKHAVGWCPNENNAVGMHDTKRDVEPEMEKVTAIKFRIDELDAYAICATFRPETVHGVTNLFVNENSKYILCRINEGKEQGIISKASSADLAFQMKIEVIREMEGKELLQKKCINPATGTTIPILPGFFVDEKRGTGLVMSVPAHAPFDYAAIERLKSSGYDVGNITPIKVLEVDISKSSANGQAKKMPVNTDIPALAYLETIGAEPGCASEVIEEATKLQYKEELHWGRMIVEGYKGMTGQEARVKIREMLEGKGMAFELYMLMNESQVFCRCGYAIVVKVVDNQWFINYGDSRWKEEVRGWFAEMKVLPEGVRNALGAAIDWIDLRAVARAQGLGTRFPFDNNYIIESLSDSTIYMSFYTISNMVRDLAVEKLKPGFFDYVFLGKGDADSVASSTGIDFQVIQKCRDSFDYWYSETSRHSGPDLIFNHLTMYLFNHVAVFDRKRWPKQIVVNGVVLSEGEKMSKSLGNTTPLMEGLARYGVDPLRAVVIAGADLLSDSDYSNEAVNGVKERFEYLYELCRNIDSYESVELKQIDYWLYSKLNRKIETTTAAMEKLELRDAFTNVLYNSILELKRYLARGGKSGIVMKDYLSNVVLMLQPIAPHMSEEMWQMLGNTSFSSTEKWRDADKSMINEKIEKGEELIAEVMQDTKEIMDLMARKGGERAKSVRIIVADDWKRDLENLLAKEKNVSAVLKQAKEREGMNMEKAAKYVGGMAKRMENVHEIGMTQEEEFEVYSEAKDYIRNMMGVEINVEKESESKSQRADRASPLKPSIDIL
jgi:leucyl-tRNA synthetase